jgi:hypothetical protein
MGRVEEGGIMYEIFLSFNGMLLQYLVLPNPFPSSPETSIMGSFQDCTPSKHKRTAI